MSRFRPKLSYSNVMASIAVFAVLGTGAAVAHHAPNNVGVNALKNGAVSTPKLRPKAVTTPKLAPQAVKRTRLAPALRPRYAVVQANGSLARGRGVVSTDALAGDGQYEVIFDRSVSTCAYIATRGSHLAADTSAATPGMVMVAGLSGEPNGVRVGTRNGFTGDNDDLAFHLQVIC